MLRILLLAALWTASVCHHTSENAIDMIENPDLGEMKPMEPGMMEGMMEMIKKMQQESLGKPDPSVGQRLSKLKPGDHVNADEMGTYLEGDILQTKASDPGTTPLWPHGVVYFEIASTFNNWQRANILNAMVHIQKHTCVRFKEYSGQERDYLSIIGENTGCWSHVGRRGGRQEVNLQPRGCLYSTGIAVHELLHALGIPHEQSRGDRDDFVSILFQNIKPVEAHNFNNKGFSGLGVPYDYASIMHYDLFAFSNNRRPTIQLRRPKPQNTEVGQRIALSRGDAAKLNRLYECSNSNTEEIIALRPPAPPQRLPKPQKLKRFLNWPPNWKPCNFGYCPKEQFVFGK